MVSKKPILDSFLDIKKPITEISTKKVVASSEKQRLRDILNLMLTRKLRKIPVVDNRQHLKGMVSSVDVLDILGGGDKHELFKKNKKIMDLKVEKFMTKHIVTINHRTSIRKTLDVFRTAGFGSYPVVDSKKLISMVSEWDIVKYLNRPLGIKVYELMVERPIFAKKEYNVYDVAKMICRGGFRRLPVVEDNILLGIVTPADILLHIHKKGKENEMVFDRTPIEKVMNSRPFTIRDDADVSLSIKIMGKEKVGGLPVLEGDELVGIITKKDILEVLS